MDTTRVQSFKLLGVQIDAKLIWGPHVSKICGTLTSGIHMLYRSKLYLSVKYLRKILIAVLLPHVYYCLVLYSRGVADSGGGHGPGPLLAENCRAGPPILLKLLVKIMFLCVILMNGHLIYHIYC